MKETDTYCEYLQKFTNILPVMLIDPKNLQNRHIENYWQKAHTMLKRKYGIFLPVVIAMEGTFASISFKTQSFKYAKLIKEAEG